DMLKICRYRFPAARFTGSGDALPAAGEPLAEASMRPVPINPTPASPASFKKFLRLLLISFLVFYDLQGISQLPYHHRMVPGYILLFGPIRCQVIELGDGAVPHGYRGIGIGIKGRTIA